MMNLTPWAVCLTAILLTLILLRKPLGALGKLCARTVVGLGGIWLFNHLGALVGIQVGVNLFTGLTVGILGLPGFALLLLLQCL